MRVKLIATISVLALSIAICVFSMAFSFSRVEDMQRMATVVMEKFDKGDHDGAREALSRMAQQWEAGDSVLKMLLPHEDLHDVTIHYVEAIADLEAVDTDDFRRSMALLDESLKHLHEHESISIANLL